MKIYWLLIGTFLAGTAWAGGWTSGGGHLFSDEQNPWFVANTYQVNYCILLDESNFGKTREQAKAAIVKAVDYWKKQFRKVEPWPFGDIKVFLGTQQFVEKDCAAANIDVTFQFGVLNDAQKAFVMAPKSTVGISVRTGYDKKLLKGRGFVYIAPKQGPLALEDHDVVSDPWFQDKALVLILIHELGHVFGMPHVNDDYNVMHENFPQSLVVQSGMGSKRNLFLTSPTKIPDFFNQIGMQGKDWTAFKINEFDFLEKFLGANKDERMDIQIREKSAYRDVWARREGGDFFKAGTGTGGEENQTLFRGYIVLSADQQVFANVPKKYIRIPTYHSDIIKIYSGFESSIDHLQRQMFIDEYPSYMRVRASGSDNTYAFGEMLLSGWQ
jgi:hypothetical protein